MLKSFQKALWLLQAVQECIDGPTAIERPTAARIAETLGIEQQQVRRAIYYMRGIGAELEAHAQSGYILVSPFSLLKAIENLLENLPVGPYSPKEEKK